MLRLSSVLTTAALVAAIAPSAITSASADHASSPTAASPTAAQPRRHAADPLVIAHRGASGYRPEHTLAAYELAARMGADFIEPDLVSTKDGVLVARHEPEISETTDVADRPEFASRRTTKSIDGRPVTGWFTSDFTLAELKSLRAKERLPELRQESTMWDGRFEVPTFDEVLELRERLTKELGREIGVYPETKHPTFFDEAGLDLEGKLAEAIRKHHLDRGNAPIFIQSFELSNLVELREELDVKAPLVFLVAGGAPYDLVAKGDSRTYRDLIQPASLVELSKTINGIGPEKSLVIPRKADGSLGAPTSLVSDAHAAGLDVHPWTFRAENVFLPVDHRSGAAASDFGRAIDEQVTFLEAGIDGLFTDQADVGVAARAEFLAGR
ncbi:glycerophosphodiester phosphodiesterase [Intrasporangium calvum]|uniref:glycerophosphodiester phosphodiesterase n=1 Tax=Intrasporangium calvum TaxID=53358 RepID=A0ABT5GK42_9MICO|nr:glycerophosphodiester phosphodiesterase [Intrasporangium calvum]MDC5698448.1 glycerophosphodiester phosphodiesterase [Intrasporangium calvum]